ncbi:hypothetical protein FQN60_000121 [Etheostoma spectabile]|uniref:Opioid growth factor receptor (OGFr) conserved domain-containing protein n=1 Tax=Etheostoma spectabile TaxID=54343 RepID=A0A5J5C9V7_9PERO|nr:hypothetical protein FQN60_000121 [Etheostoma spectabile]
MLDFYGIKLLDKSGNVARAPNWLERFQHLNESQHNYLRITRILKSLGELGYEAFKAPLVRLFLEESLCRNTLPNMQHSVLEYFVYTIRLRPHADACSATPASTTGRPTPSSGDRCPKRRGGGVGVGGSVGAGSSGIRAPAPTPEQHRRGRRAPAPHLQTAGLLCLPMMPCCARIWLQECHRAAQDSLRRRLNWRERRWWREGEERGTSTMRSSLCRGMGFDCFLLSVQLFIVPELYS